MGVRHMEGRTQAPTQDTSSGSEDINQGWNEQWRVLDEGKLQSDSDADSSAAAVALTHERSAEGQGRDVLGDVETHVPLASTQLTEVRQRPAQPLQCPHKEATAEIFDDISSFLEACAIFKQSDFDGQVRQHLHAIRTVGGRKRVQEALDKVRAGVQGVERSQLKSPSRYLLALFKRLLQTLKNGRSMRDDALAVCRGTAFDQVSQ